MKECIVFTSGDAESAKTWSNVPYYLTKNLELQGVKVHRINISELGMIPSLYRKVWNRILKKQKNSYWDARRTSFYTWFVRNKMKKSLKQYPNATAAISLTYSYACPHLKSIKTVMLCDWTLWRLIERENRVPTSLEKKSIKVEDSQIMKSDIVISLYPDVAERMSQYYNKQVYYLGNYININQDQLNIDLAAISSKKAKSHNYLFIGKKDYQKSAENLIEALSVCQTTHSDQLYSVTIIGLRKSDFSTLPDNITIEFLGYLDKNNPDQKEIYYDRMINARAIVNTTEKWAGPSSVFEAMYYGTPVITIPNRDFLLMVGEDSEIGYYCKENSVKEISEAIEKISGFRLKELFTISQNAHNAVKDFTWENYTRKLIQVMDN